MQDEMTLTLNSPITEEQWDDIMDVDFDRTDRITFHTKHGREVEFVKRKKGKWMPLQLSIAYPPYQCSCCFGNAPMVMVETGRLKKGHLEALLTDFCPNCGADMRGEQDG